MISAHHHHRNVSIVERQIRWNADVFVCVSTMRIVSGGRAHNVKSSTAITFASTHLKINYLH